MDEEFVVGETYFPTNCYPTVYQTLMLAYTVAAELGLRGVSLLPSVDLMTWDSELEVIDNTIETIDNLSVSLIEEVFDKVEKPSHLRVVH